MAEETPDKSTVGVASPGLQSPRGTVGSNSNENGSSDPPRGTGNTAVEQLSTFAGSAGGPSKSSGNSSPRSPKHPRKTRIKLSELQLETATRDDLAAKWREQDLYIECLETQLAAQEGELACLRDSEEKYRQQCCEVSHRERILVRRLASKEQQMLGYVNQITEMRATHTPTASALRSALLDPAVNILVQKLRQELLSTKAKLEDTQNELSAWKFTPDSNTGKRLMAKCRLLYQENEELGRMIASGRIAKLEGELVLQKSFSEEVKKSQSELDEFLQDLDEDVEGMQSTIYFLQQELRKARESVSLLQQENEAFKSASESPPEPAPPPPPPPPPASSDALSNGTAAAKEATDERPEENKIEDEVPAETTKCRPDEPDESSNDSAALIIKVDNEDLSEDEGVASSGTTAAAASRSSQRQSTRRNAAKSESGVVIRSNGDERTRRLVRERTAKRDKSAADSGDDERIHKKKRRESILSLDYNETDDDDALLLTNGENIQSDTEDGP